MLTLFVVRCDLLIFTIVNDNRYGTHYSHNNPRCFISYTFHLPTHC